MKNLMKRALVLVTAATMILGSFPQVSGAQEALSPNAYGLYPTAAYSAVSAELDVTGAWKYRELVPDVACEEEALLGNRGSNIILSGATTKQTDAKRIDTDKYAGNYSWYRRGITNRGIGFEIPAGVMKSGQEFISSAWLRSDMEGATADTEAKRTAVRPFANWQTGETQMGTLRKISKEWGKYDLGFSVPSDYIETNPFRVAVVNADGANVITEYNTYSEVISSSESRPVYSIYLDEWSLRMAIPTDFPASYVKSISPSPEKPAIKNGEDLTFKFSLDIDPRTVRKENITVNGTKNSPLVNAVKVTTAEATRETTLTISFNTLEEGTAYTVALPEIKDAWGRDVVGTTTASITCVPADAEYTIYEELDASGKWAYRNLVPDADCSNADLFYEGDVLIDKGQTFLSVDTEDYHSGGSSITRILRNNGKIGFEVTNYDTTAEYYVAAWLKANCKENEPVSASYASDLYTTNGDTTKKSELELAVGTKPEITNEWGYYTTKVSRPKSSGAVIPAYTGTNATRVWLMNTENSHGLKKDSDNRWLNEINVDDWSWRKIPSWNVNATGVSVNGKTAVFTFDKDIDKWTVTADKILVNGEKNNGRITGAVVNTNEITRVTTLTVTATKNIDDDFVVSLPAEARDAWGREIAGIKSTGLFYEEKVTDASGNVVEETDMTAGTRNYVIENIVNNTSKEINMTAIIALYNADKTLESVNLKGVRLAPGQKAEELKVSVTIPELPEEMSVKCFLWNMDTLCPFK